MPSKLTEFCIDGQCWMVNVDRLLLTTFVFLIGVGLMLGAMMGACWCVGEVWRGVKIVFRRLHPSRKQQSPPSLRLLSKQKTRPM